LGSITHLSPDFRGRLLSSCLYGVDIDQQAVEVTIMSLYLKLLEGRLPPHWQQDFLERGLLPPMDNNICCGNSLMSKTDFDRYWDDKHGSLFGGDEDVKFRMNPFDWTSETRGFGSILADGGGFDCVIGNPPYIRVQELNKWSPEECEFYKWHFKSAAKGNYDIYVVFIERGLELLAPDGLLGYICPHKFWQAQYGKAIREILTQGCHIRSILDFTDQQVFRGATTYTAIHIFTSKGKVSSVDYARITTLTDGEQQCRAIASSPSLKLADMARWQAPHPSPDAPGWSFPPIGALRIEPAESTNTFNLADLVEFSQGFKTGADSIFVVEYLAERDGLARVRSKATGNEHLVEPASLRLLIKSEHMRRFEILPTKLRLVFPYSVSGAKWRILDPDDLAATFPKLWYEYLLPCRAILDRRESGRFKGKHFYQYSRQQNFIPLSKPKLVTPDMADHMRFSYDEKGDIFFSGGAAGGVCVRPGSQIAPELLLGIMNSRLVERLIRDRNGVGYRGGYMNCEIRFLRNVPVHLPKGAIEGRIAKQICNTPQKLDRWLS
jgi:hypothetical protein